MITSRSDNMSRRMLTFPAIHPCNDVEPSTLINSLIVLARNIVDRSRRFTVHRRNAKEAIRQVTVLLLFLEDVKDGKSDAPGSVLVCFIELHIAFQKLKYLLDDISHEGGKLWVLSKAGRVSDAFRMIFRAVATALEVLPLCLIDVGNEVREMVELVSKQVHNAMFLVDAEDEMVDGHVKCILRQFEQRVVPDTEVLKRILDHLGVNTWHDCYKEMKFLEEKMELTSLGDKKESIHLNDLMGFMSYCRGVVFNSVDGQGKTSNTQRPNVRLGCLNSDDVRCPISLELMTDPVTVASGHTYDRVSIQRWFKAGNIICPKTGEKLKSTALVSNIAVQNLIRQFCQENGMHFSDVNGNKPRDISKTVLPGSVASREAMHMLAEYLADRLICGSMDAKNKAAYEIRLLAKANIFNRSCLAETGMIIPTLLNLLFSTESSVQENAIAALLNLSKYSTSKILIVENGGLLPILDVLSKGLTTEAKQLAAATLFYISSVEDYRILIGEIPDAINVLAEMIKTGPPRGKKNAVVAIFSLLSYPGNHQLVLDAGTVPLLVDILKSPEQVDLLVDSLAVLATLAENIDGTIAILCELALPQLVTILQSSSSKTAKEYCVSILHSLATNGGTEVIAILQKTPSLVASLYSLLTDGTTRASKKASSVLSIIHQFQNVDARSLSPNIAQEHFVHVR